MTSLVDRIDALDQSIAKLVKATLASPEARDALMQHYAKRGSIQVDIGLAEAGLSDLLRAHAQSDGLNTRIDAQSFDQLYASYAPAASPGQPVPYWLWARLGEGFRRYALDVLLTQSNGEHKLYEAIHRSIDCFKKAEASQDETVPGGAKATPAMRAWIVAHRGAARTTLFWMSVSASDPSARVFKTASDEFESAIKIHAEDKSEYVWAKQFHAFLYALRGRPGDFKTAHSVLKSIATASPLTQSSLNRSLAMLSSYDAVPPPTRTASQADPKLPPGARTAAEALAERQQAARDSLESAMQAVTQDPEDFLASYFGAVSTWILGNISDDKVRKEAYAKRARAAIEGARARSTSAISQAYATLVGLDLMTSMMTESRATASMTSSAANRAASVLEKLSDFQPDWETRAIFMRDPVWQTIKNDLQHQHIQEALEGHPTFDALREKFKMWTGRINPEDET